jgi:hypothetical protein
MRCDLTADPDLRNLKVLCLQGGEAKRDALLTGEPKGKG